jgi:uncharacterized membrane protein
MITLAFLAALGCGLTAGVFFAFSSFVMPALGQLAPHDGILAMQWINRLAVTPLFMAALFGTALLCLSLMIWASVAWNRRPSRWIVPAAAVFLIGVIGVTVAANVPRNDALEQLDPQAAASATQWSSYLSEWTAFNHVRTTAALLATAMFILALRVGDGQPSLVKTDSVA